MITQQQANALHVGDVVELVTDTHPDVKVVGPLTTNIVGDLTLGSYAIIRTVGGLVWNTNRSLRVLKKAQEPLYANHPRTAPVQGDVVRHTHPHPAYSANLTWWFSGTEWYSHNNASPRPIVGGMPRGVTLLVDGETGRPVQ